MDRLTIGGKLKELRKAEGLTQQALAVEFNIKQDDISRFEHDKQELNLFVLSQYCKRFSVSADYLLGLTNTPTTDRDVSFVCDYTGLSERAVQVLNAYHLIYTENPNPEYEKALSLFVEQASLNDLISYIMAYRSALSLADDIERQYQLLLDKYQFCLKHLTADNVISLLQYPDIDRYKDRLNLSLLNMSELPKEFARKHFEKESQRFTEAVNKLDGLFLDIVRLKEKVLEAGEPHGNNQETQ